VQVVHDILRVVFIDELGDVVPHLDPLKELADSVGQVQSHDLFLGAYAGVCIEAEYDGFEEDR